MIEILKADRSSSNECEGKDMYSCISVDGVVECYFPTKSSHDRNTGLFSIAERMKQFIDHGLPEQYKRRFYAILTASDPDQETCKHVWLHPGTSPTMTHCVKCGIAYTGNDPRAKAND